MLIILSYITFYEFISIKFLNNSPANIFYLNDTFIDFNNKNSGGPFGYRPYGLLFYPQVNGVMIAFLLSLYLFSIKKLNLLFFLSFFALIISQSYSGILFFILFFSLTFKFNNKFIISCILIFTLLVIFIFGFFENFFYKLSLEYFRNLIFREGQLIDQIISIKFLSISEIFFGKSQSFDDMSHEWYYFSIVKEFGIIGLIIFFLVYSKIIFNLLPNISHILKNIYVLIFLFINLHYPSIAFLPFQILIVIIYILRAYKID